MKQTRDNAVPPTPNATHHHGMAKSPSGSLLFRYEDHIHIDIFLSYLKVDTFYNSLNYLA